MAYFKFSFLQQAKIDFEAVDYAFWLSGMLLMMPGFWMLDALSKSLAITVGLGAAYVLWWLLHRLIGTIERVLALAGLLLGWYTVLVAALALRFHFTYSGI